MTGLDWLVAVAIVLGFAALFLAVILLGERRLDRRHAQRMDDLDRMIAERRDAP